MTVLRANRLLGGGRVAAAGLLLTLLFAMASAAQPGGEIWATRAGDNPRWSRPEFDDSAWQRVAVRSTWREQGRQTHDGIVWFRYVAPLSDEARLAGGRNELGLL